MSFVFGDGFDCYAATADLYPSYWDTGTSVNFLIFSPGRFAGSRALQGSGSGVWLTKSSGVNGDAVHHITCAIQQTATVTGSTLGFYFQLLDGTTNQCAIVFRSDGAIVLTSGGPTGTALATYTGAVSLVNTWFAFEIEVAISNTAGYMNVRKNGNPANDFTSATTLDTQNSANAYANKLTIGVNASVNSQIVDDLFWRSDASSVAWLGDIRCQTRMPASDAAVQWSRTPTGVLTQTAPPATGFTLPGGSNTAAYTAFTAAYDGTVTSVGVTTVAVGTAVNMKCAIFADNGSGRPGALLASATAPVTPVVVGTHTFAFTGLSVVKGTQYWIGAAMDGTTGMSWNATSGSVTTGATSTTSYAAFPQTNPVTTMPAQGNLKSMTYTATPANWQAVSEAQQDAATSYVYSSTVGQEDYYGIASIASTPVSTFMVTTRAYMQKSDAGTRTAAAQLKSGASVVASPTVVLTTSGWQWAWRSDTTDPAGGNWTAAAVNNAQVGVKVIA